MASATSKVAPVTTYTGNAQQRRSGKARDKKDFYKTQTTTLVGGGTKVETYRTDAKGNNAVKISESEVDAKGNVTKQETLSTASAAEKRALSNPDSRLSRSVKNQVEDTKKQLKDANVSNLDKKPVVLLATLLLVVVRKNLNLLQNQQNLHQVLIKE